MNTRHTIIVLSAVGIGFFVSISHDAFAGDKAVITPGGITVTDDKGDTVEINPNGIFAPDGSIRIHRSKKAAPKEQPQRTRSRAPRGGKPSTAGNDAGQNDGGQIVIADHNQRLDLQCRGREVVIEGCCNVVTLHGTCRTVTVNTGYNTITVDAAESITTNGANNTVRWVREVNGIAPEINNPAAGNLIGRVERISTQQPSGTAAVRGTRGAEVDVQGGNASVRSSTGTVAEVETQGSETPGARTPRATQDSRGPASSRGALAAASQQGRGAGKRRLTEPVRCGGAQDIRLENVYLEVPGDAVTVEGSCDVTISNSEIVAGGWAVVIGGAGDVHVQESILDGQRGAVTVEGSGEIFASSTTFNGRVNQGGVGKLHDRGDNVWGKSTTAGAQNTDTKPAPDDSGDTDTSFDRGEQIVIWGNDEHRTLDCRGKTVAVNGNNNMLTFRGTCNKVSVLGNENTLGVEVTPSISTVGNSNRVTWARGFDGSPPRVTNLGSDNVIRQSAK